MTGYASNRPISWNTLENVSRVVAAEKFDHLIRQARFANFWQRLTGRPETLLSFKDQSADMSGVTGLNRGVREIPVEAIVGSVNRNEDYDRQFRPLRPMLKDRWINVLVLSEYRGWEPIVVRQIGDQYFIEDGHHRVSVARHSGLEFIEAQVFEYPQPAHSGKAIVDSQVRSNKQYLGGNPAAQASSAA